MWNTGTLGLIKRVRLLKASFVVIDIRTRGFSNSSGPSILLIPYGPMVTTTTLVLLVVLPPERAMRTVGNLIPSVLSPLVSGPDIETLRVRTQRLPVSLWVTVFFTPLVLTTVIPTLPKPEPPTCKATTKNESRVTQRNPPRHLTHRNRQAPPSQKERVDP